MRENEAIKCGICGDGILKTTNPSGPKEGLEKRVSSGKGRQMKGSDELKREAVEAWSLKVGFCEDCVRKHGLDNKGIDHVISKISLARVAKIPQRSKS
jgi:hypothetical protein